jgi:hypothetical protein
VAVRAQADIDVSQAEDGQFNMTIQGDRATTAETLVSQLTSSIIGLYLTYRDEDA